MSPDEIEGRLVALEVLAFANLTGVVGDWHAAGASVEEIVGFLDTIRQNVKEVAAMEKLTPSATNAAAETADRICADVSERMAGRQTGRVA